MFKKLSLVGVILALLVLMPAVALAEEEPDNRTEIGDVTDPTGGVVKLNLNYSHAISPVPLPMPIEPPVRASSTYEQSSGNTSLGGSSIVAPRGGAMSTPKQQADREIRRLIRRLG